MPPNTDPLLLVVSIIGNGTRAESIGTTVARGRTTDCSSASCSSCERSVSGTRNPPSDGDTDEAALRSASSFSASARVFLCQMLRT